MKRRAEEALGPVPAPVSQKKKRNTTQSGDIPEDYVRQLLRESILFEQVQGTPTSHKLDATFIVCRDGTRRGIQIKKLRRVERAGWKTYFQADHVSGYHEDTLMVCVNPEDEKAVMFFSRQRPSLGNVTVAVYYTEKDEPAKDSNAFYQQFIVPWSELRHRLYEMAQTSTLVVNDDDFMTETCRLELQMMARFIPFANAFPGHAVRRNESHGDAADLFDFATRLQLKASRQVERKRANSEAPGYVFNLKKGGRKPTPYAIGDADFFIFQIAQPARLQHEYCIIPQQVLLEKGYLYDPATGRKGRKKIFIFPLEFRAQFAKLKASKKAGPRLRGNWTCDPQYWYNASSRSLPF